MNALALPPDFAARVRARRADVASTRPGTSAVRRICSSRRSTSPTSRRSCAALRRTTPVMWIGLGSNLLVRDGGIRGAVIETHGVLDELERSATTEVCAEAAWRARSSRKQCIKWGLGPAEFFAGIPGTLGGALAMNAGAFGGETWRHVLERRDDRSRAACGASGRASDYVVGYRHVSGPANEWFLGARFRFEPRPGVEQRRHPDAARAPQGDAADRRMACGSVFTQSAGRSRGAPDRHARASRVIASAARASRRCTRTSSSTTATASAARHRAADRHVMTTVERVHGVQLKPEVRIVGSRTMSSAASTDPTRTSAASPC